MKNELEVKSVKGNENNTVTTKQMEDPTLSYKSATLSTAVANYFCMDTGQNVQKIDSETTIPFEAQPQAPDIIDDITKGATSVANTAKTVATAVKNRARNINCTPSRCRFNLRSIIPRISNPFRRSQNQENNTLQNEHTNIEMTQINDTDTNNSQDSIS